MYSVQSCSSFNSSNTITVLDGCFTAQLKCDRYCCTDTQAQLRYYDIIADTYINVHLDFLHAGATAIKTHTFWISDSFMIEKFKHTAEEFQTVLEESVTNVHKALDTYVNDMRVNMDLYKVVGSCGSATKTNTLSINTSNRSKFKDFHKMRVGILDDIGVDILAFESIECAEEARAITELVQEYPSTKAWISFHLRGTYLKDGSNLVRIARECYQSAPNQIVAVGFNCAHPLYADNIVKSFNSSCNAQDKVPLIVYPRKTKFFNSYNKWRPFHSPAKFSVSEWANCGIRYVGGCCDVLPEDIRTISEEIKEFNKSEQS